MEAIATYTILLVQFVGNGIHIGIVGHRLMESRIEDSNLRHIRQDSLNGTNTFQVGRIVERSQVVARRKGIEHFLGQQDRFTELLATMNHTMTYCIDFVQRLDGTIFRRDKGVQDKFHTHCMLRNILFQNLLLTVWQRQLQERIGQTNLFNTTLGNDCLVVHVEQLIFDR